jgi:hypothetical protein
MRLRIWRSFIVSAAFCLLFSAVSYGTAITILANPGVGFTPAGANFSIYGVQGLAVGPAVPTLPMTTAYVIQNNEFDGSIGVGFNTDPTGSGKFGVGIYNPASPLSAGLKISFTSAVTTGTSLSAVIADFDLNKTDDRDANGHPIFDTGKVIPDVLLLAPNGSILSAFGPNDVKNAMTFLNVTDGDDYWTLNLGVLSPNTAISGYVLYANTANKNPSDPYFFVSADNGRTTSMVPEPTTLVMLGSGLLGLAAIVRRRKGR